MASKPERDATAAAAVAEVKQLEEVAAKVPLHAENEWKIRCYPSLLDLQLDLLLDSQLDF